MLKRRNKKAKYAVGGVAGEMNELLAEGGMMDNSGEVVNGTEVPAGSLREEVSDDVPAMLSEGEFVVPADVVRYVGLEKLMKMRDQAKAGLERMEEMGQMGNAEEVVNPDQQFAQVDDIAFENDIDSIMGEVDREGASMQTDRMFAAAGGFVTGTDLSKAVQNPAVDVRYYKHDDGRVMYITHINDKPMTAVPDGFKEVAADEVRQVGKKAEETAAAGVGSGTGAVGSVWDGGGGDSGPVGTGDGGPVGIGPTGLAATGLGLMAISENLSKTPTISAQIARGVTGVVGKGLADQSIAQTTSGFESMQQAASVPGIMSVSGPQGQVTTVSTPASIAAADAAMFGAPATTGPTSGISEGFDGSPSAPSANVGAQEGFDGSPGVSGPAAVGPSGGISEGFDGSPSAPSASVGGQEGFDGSPGGGFGGGDGGGGDSGVGVGDSGPSGSSGAGGASAAGPGESDGGGGGGGGGKIICTKLYELGLMDKDVYEADQAYGALVAAKDPALMDGYHYWANIVVDWMSGSGVRVIPFVSDAKHGAIAAKWATKWAQEIATPWAEHMQYEMGQRKEDSKIGKALMTIGGPISRLFANRKERPSTLTAFGCIATFVTLYAFVKVAKLFTK
jgi:hypothetical protein